MSIVVRIGPEVGMNERENGENDGRYSLSYVWPSDIVLGLYVEWGPLFWGCVGPGYIFKIQFL